jgi:CDI toxin RNase A-like protein
MVRPGTAHGRRPWGVGSVAGWCARIVASLPLSVVFVAAALVWLAGAWLVGSAGSAAPATVVVPVVSTVPSVGADGSDDQNAAAGGTPKSPGASHPQGNSDSSGSTGGSHDSGSGSAPKSAPAQHPQGNDSSGNGSGQGGQGGQTQTRPPASHQPPPGDNGGGDGGDGGIAKPPPAGQKQPAPSQGQGGEQGGTPRRVTPAARPGDQGADQSTVRVRPVGLTQRPQPGDGTTLGAQPATQKTGQPRRPNPDCPTGCGGAPAVPPTPAPVPSAGSGGAGSGGAGGTGGQPGIDNGVRPAVAAKPAQLPQAQQPDGQVIKNKDPRTGLDPPAGSDIPAPNTLPKPGQPGAPAQSGQVSDNSTLPGLAPVGTPRVVAASAQIPQAGQAVPVLAAHIRPLPSDDSGTGGEDVLRRLAGAGLVVGGAALTAASAAGVLAGGVATAGTGGAAAPLTVPEMMGAAGGISAGVGMMGTGMAMATEPSSSAGAIPHPRSEEPAAPEAAPKPRDEDAPRSPLAPDGGLQAQEDAGGHTLDPSRAHVGASDQELLDRLNNNPGLHESSSFYDRAAAERAAHENIAGNEKEIEGWLNDPNGPPTQEFDWEHDHNVGRYLERGSSGARDVKKSRVVLRRDSSMPRGYKILTSYPRPSE